MQKRTCGTHISGAFLDKGKPVARRGRKATGLQVGLEAAGQPIPDDAKIPLTLIENPFHRAYYAAKGWVK